MYSRLKVILIILLSIVIFQFALPLFFIWKSEEENDASDQPVQPSLLANVKKSKFSDLPFELPCIIRSKSAASAIERAKSVACKKELVDITCKMQKNQLYPKVLQTTCPHKGESFELSVRFPFQLFFSPSRVYQIQFTA